MLQFSDTELFTTGKKGLHTFDYPDLNLFQQDGFVSKSMADYYYNHFLCKKRLGKNIRWKCMRKL